MTAALNLTALTEPVTAEQVRRFRQEVETAKRHEQPSIGMVVMLAVYALLTFTLSAWIAVGIITKFIEGSTDWLSLIGGPLLVALFAAFAVFLLLAARHELVGKNKLKRWLRLERFAAANQLSYARNEVHPGFPGSLFHAGQDQSITEHLYRPITHSPDIGNYVYMTGSGRGRAAHLWGYAAIRLPRRLPHIVLDATANNGLRSTLPTRFTRDQKLGLEGDFNNHFTLYCPAEYERDALYILTPDLMALLVDGTGGAFDVEVIDDWMFLYSTHKLDLADPDTLTRLHTIIDTIGERMRNSTALYADPRTTPEPSRLVDVRGNPLQTRMSHNEVTVEGRRLKPVAPVATYVTIALLAVVGVGSVALLLLFG